MIRRIAICGAVVVKNEDFLSMAQRLAGFYEGQYAEFAAYGFGLLNT